MKPVLTLMSILKMFVLVVPMVMSAVVLSPVTSVKVKGDTSLHLVKAMLMAFLVSSTFRVLGNLMILTLR